MVAAAGERLVMPSEEFLYDWQTLVAGVLALIAAIWTILKTRELILREPPLAQRPLEVWPLQLVPPNRQREHDDDQLREVLAFVHANHPANENAAGNEAGAAHALKGPAHNDRREPRRPRRRSPLPRYRCARPAHPRWRRRRPENQGDRRSKWRKKARRPPPALSRQDAARMLGLSLRSIDRLIHSGKLKARRVGRRVFLSPDALERFLAALPRNATSSSAALFAAKHFRGVGEIEFAP
jgi:excisionase family DNA binding protein